jgi:hypothetical protein
MSAASPAQSAAVPPQPYVGDCGASPMDELDIAFVAPDRHRRNSVVRTHLHTVDRGLMTTQQHPHLTLDHPSELLASVPDLLGFHPTDSLVVLSCTCPPPATDAPGPTSAEAVAAVYSTRLATPHPQSADRDGGGVVSNPQQHRGAP